ncbi:polysaccharide deacetylase family protein [Geomonas azotofigens]|uniref:polysaccharide deacetylase family protein n=1 Tax=Geomonas azotofigens TaxID=2843196 RepID=UPI001C11E2B6|nr:polysaccharide deacetylase family protein [Geomonas azotofigens]MBU5613498.1 polysaccharide deacetylase family protein [Geomonas azotofigens]
MKIKFFVKKYMACVAHRLGLLDAACTLKARSGALVLTYHRVLDSAVLRSSFVQPGMYVSPESFREQLSFLMSKFSIVSLTELVDRMRKGKAIGGCCCVTLDDGWHDNYLNAFPVLQALNVPATIFLATGFIGTTKYFWPEEVSFYLRSPAIFESRHSIPCLRQLLSLSGTFASDSFLEASICTIKKWPLKQREDLVAELRSRSGTVPPGRAIMDWSEVQAMQASGLVSFGAHTAHHEILDQVDATTAENEIVQSKIDIESHLDMPVSLFAYPNGNFSQGLHATLARNGFTGAVTTRKGWVNSNSELLALPRIAMHQDVSQTNSLFFARTVWERF